MSEKELREREIEKLELEIAQLKRPLYQRPTFWTSVFGIMLALAGTLGQRNLSQLTVEKAEFNTVKTIEQRDQSLKEQKLAEASRDTALVALEYAIQERELARKDEVALRKLANIKQNELSQLIQRFANLKALIEDLQIESSELTERIVAFKADIDMLNSEKITSFSASVDVEPSISAITPVSFKSDPPGATVSIIESGLQRSSREPLRSGEAPCRFSLPAGNYTATFTLNDEIVSRNFTVYSPIRFDFTEQDFRRIVLPRGRLPHMPPKE